MFPHDTIAIIPAAGSRYGTSGSDAMITVAGKPAIYWTMRALTSHGIRKICVVVRESSNDLERFVRLVYGGLADLTFVVPDRLAGVGYSVACGAKAVGAGRRPILIVLGDTILDTADFAQMDGSWVAVSPVDDQRRWCMARLDGGKVVELFDKPQSQVPAKHACIGVYYLREGLSPDWVDLHTAAGALDSIEMVNILRPLIASGDLAAQVSDRWLDVGNPDHLQEARQRLIQSRSFNSLELDTLRGTVTKRSSYRSKFYDEINYFKILPEELSVYFPRVHSSSNLPGKEYLTMEYYAYPTLADLFLFDELPIGFWRKAFSRLRAICDDFSKYDYGPENGDAKEIYVSKNIERFEAYLAKPPSIGREIVMDSRLTVNGIPVPTPREAIAWSRQRLETIAKQVHWTPIHGDLCLSNILCEPNSCLIKLLDPRGSFGHRGVLGDRRYDIAKLAHSIIGRYDFIVNDLYRIEVEGGDLILEFPHRKHIEPIVAEFEAVFLPVTNRSDVILITAWLFLSMLPLHSDHPKRQLAMLAVGLRLISNLTENENLL